MLLAAAILPLSTSCSTSRTRPIVFNVLDQLDLVTVPAGSTITPPTGSATTVRKAGYYASSNYWFQVLSVRMQDKRND